jgi:Spy/CpxP family protein refolding chaperone
MRLTGEANEDVKNAHNDVKNLALGPKQNAVLNHLYDAPSSNPKNTAKHLRAALSALGKSNPVASARIKQSLAKVNAAGKSWDEHFGFNTQVGSGY